MNTAAAAIAFEHAKSATVARMIRELASDLADLVESGDLTETEANEWLASKQDQWARK